MNASNAPKPMIVSEAFEDKTLAAFIKASQSQASWSQVKKMIVSGDVLVGKNRIRDEAFRLRAGQEVRISAESGRKSNRAKGSGLGFGKKKEGADVRLIHVDEEIVVVEKPEGMTTIRHPLEWQAYGEKAKFLPKTLAQLLPRLVQREMMRRGRKENTKALKAVHRLDKETSGLLVFARTSRAATHLSQQFKDHTVARTYQAIVVGAVSTGTIKSHLALDRGDGMRGSIPSEGKLAITHIKEVKRFGAFSWILCSLETGRTHQIRIHMAEQGTPVCGETVYIKQMKRKPLEDPSGLRRLALHAASLGFTHPGTGKRMEFLSPFPLELQRFLDKKSRQNPT